MITVKINTPCASLNLAWFRHGSGECNATIDSSWNTVNANGTGLDYESAMTDALGKIEMTDEGIDLADVCRSVFEMVRRLHMQSVKFHDLTPYKF